MRPKISLAGPQNSGPTANPRTKIDTVISCSRLDVMLSLAATWPDAGAIIEDERGLRARDTASAGTGGACCWRSGRTREE